MYFSPFQTISQRHSRIDVFRIMEVFYGRPKPKEMIQKCFYWQKYNFFLLDSMREELELEISHFIYFLCAILVSSWSFLVCASLMLACVWPESRMNWCTDQDFLWHKNRLYKKRISIFDKREEAKVAISIFSIIDFFG